MIVTDGRWLHYVLKITNMLLRLGIIFLSIQTILTQNLGERCTIANRGHGVCTKRSKCASAMREYENTGTDPTYCKRVNPGDTRLVCCKNEPSNKRPQATRKPPEVFWGSETEKKNDKRRVSERKCSEYNEAVEETIGFIPLLPKPKVMTISGAKCDYTGVELIVGGQDTKQGEFPHMAAIGWIDHGDILVFECGGSLISSRFVLTAGHCIYNPRKKIRVPSIARLGEQNLDPVVNDGARPIDVKIKSVIKHPKYAPPSKYDDIALFELDEEVNRTDIRPACLWTNPGFGTYEKAIATGWGANITRGQGTKELQKVSLSLLQNDYCDGLLIDARYRNWAGFVPTQMCAGELRGGKDTCQGDSGSPLQVVSQDNKCIFHIVGITSFGQGCARSGLPAVYTRVSSYLDWIESVVWPGE